MVAQAAIFVFRERSVSLRIGLGELIVILIFAVAYISPEKLPEYTKKITQILKQVKTAVAGAKETTQPIQDAIKPAVDLKDSISTQVDEIKSEVTNFGKEN